MKTYKEFIIESYELTEAPNIFQQGLNKLNRLGNYARGFLGRTTPRVNPSLLSPTRLLRGGIGALATDMLFPEPAGPSASKEKEAIARANAAAKARADAAAKARADAAAKARADAAAKARADAAAKARADAASSARNNPPVSTGATTPQTRPQVPTNLPTTRPMGDTPTAPRTTATVLSRTTTASTRPIVPTTPTKPIEPTAPPVPKPTMARLGQDSRDSIFSREGGRQEYERRMRQAIRTGTKYQPATSGSPAMNAPRTLGGGTAA